MREGAGFYGSRVDREASDAGEGQASPALFPSPERRRGKWKESFHLTTLKPRTAQQEVQTVHTWPAQAQKSHNQPSIRGLSFFQNSRLPRGRLAL